MQERKAPPVLRQIRWGLLVGFAVGMAMAITVAILIPWLQGRE